VTLAHVDEAVESGACLKRVCSELEIAATTLRRWRRDRDEGDLRSGPKTEPRNKLTEQERQVIIDVACSPEFRDLSPKQIVPRLADRGEYIASESTFYRVLRDEKLLKHRGRAKAANKRHRPEQKVATAPCQVWSWDITYLQSPVRGSFFYLYLVLDVWSRKIVGWEVHESELSSHSAQLLSNLCAAEHINHDQLTLHSDNGGPMKGATMLATLQELGVAASFSRPRVSNDNPYSESLFRTCKYRPNFPSKPFASIDAAREWVAAFVDWYNNEHQHSGIQFVTPSERHAGSHLNVLANRKTVYELARANRPERWSRSIRCFDPIKTVTLNPKLEDTQLKSVA
jgi:putative transposase